MYHQMNEYEMSEYVEELKFLYPDDRNIKFYNHFGKQLDSFWKVKRHKTAVKVLEAQEKQKHMSIQKPECECS